MLSASLSGKVNILLNNMTMLDEINQIAKNTGMVMANNNPPVQKPKAPQVPKKSFPMDIISRALRFLQGK